MTWQISQNESDNAAYCLLRVYNVPWLTSTMLQCRSLSLDLLFFLLHFRLVFFVVSKLVEFLFSVFFLTVNKGEVKLSLSCFCVLFLDEVHHW